MCFPGACARRVGVYFPGVLLLFGYAFTFRVGVYPSGSHLLSGWQYTHILHDKKKIQATPCASLVLVLTV